MRNLQFVLFGLNVVFWVVGSVMLGVGIWLAATGEEDWATAMQVIVVGALHFIVSFVGCIGAARADRNTCFFWTYLASISLIIVLEIVSIVWTAVDWSKSLDPELAARMYIQVQYFYVNETSADETSSWWNNFQEDSKCCGSYGYTDYFGSKYDKNAVDDIRIPYTCCVNQVDIEQRLECQNGNEDFIHLQGCYDASIEAVNYDAKVQIGVLSAFVTLQLMGLAMACVLIKKKMTKDR